MTHADLVLRAVRWLRRCRCTPVFAEMVTSVSETPDVIGWNNGFSRVVEVKISRSDFFRDRYKAHASAVDAGMGSQRWYLVPPGLVAPAEVPEWCGLLYAEPRSIVMVRNAPERDRYNFRGEARMLASALRRRELGVQFDARSARWEPYDASKKRKAGAPELAHWEEW